MSGLLDGMTPQQKVRLIGASVPLADTVLVALADDPDPVVRTRLLMAEQRVLPDAAVARLAVDPDSRVVAVLVGTHRPLPGDVLRIVAAHPAVSVRSALAESWRTVPVDVLHRFTYDQDPAVRVSVARHPGTVPDPLLIALAGDEPDVQHALLTRAALPPDAVEALARSGDVDVRRALVARPFPLPDPAAETLAVDPDLDVRVGLAADRRRPLPIPAALSLAGDAATVALPLIGSDRWLPVPAWDLLAAHADPDVRAAAAQADRSRFSGNALLRLAGDADETVAAVVATRVDLTPAVLVVLAMNPAGGQAAEDAAVRFLGPRGAWHRRLRDDTDASVRALVARYTRHRYALAAAVGDEAAVVRAAAAINVRCPADLLDTLVGDLDETVSDAVTRRLLDAD